jgi:hypothetical protein
VRVSTAILLLLIAPERRGPRRLLIKQDDEAK